MRYIDASTLVAALLPERGSDAAFAALAHDPGAPLAASAWVLTELVSALAIKQRTGQISAAHRTEAGALARHMLADSFVMLPITAAHFEAATRFVEVCAEPLRGGDALHLAVAAAHGARVVTLDRRMTAAAQALGVEVSLLDTGS